MRRAITAGVTAGVAAAVALGVAGGSRLEVLSPGSPGVSGPQVAARQAAQPAHRASAGGASADSIAADRTGAARTAAARTGAARTGADGTAADGTSAEGTPAERTSAADKVAPTRTIEFGSYTLTVPASWPVYQLAADPQRCVRFDVHAVYLGHPGPDQRCPAHLVGHEDALWLDSTGSPAPEDPGVPGISSPAPGAPDRKGSPHAGSAAGGPVSPATSAIVRDTLQGEVRAEARSPGLSITATYGSDPSQVERIIQSIRRAADLAPGSASAAPAAATPAPFAAAPRPVVPSRSRVPQAVEVAAVTRPAAKKHPARRGTGGRAGATKRFPAKPVPGFDTCTTPSRAALAAWRGRASVVGIYIGGVNRACPSGNLSASWVRSARAAGWHLLPTYVGLQPSCDHFSGRIDPARAASEGRAAADDAVTQAGNLGIGRGAPIYADMEEYNRRNAGCRRAVLTFLDAWTRELHARHYTSGVYSSYGSGARDLASTGSIGGHSLAKPDSIWIGRWDGKKDLSAGPYVPSSAWSGQRRVKQFQGAHWETHNRVRLNIDSDWVYGRVYLVQQPCPRAAHSRCAATRTRSVNNPVRVVAGAPLS